MIFVTACLDNLVPEHEMGVLDGEGVMLAVGEAISAQIGMVDVVTPVWSIRWSRSGLLGAPANSRPSQAQFRAVGEGKRTQSRYHAPPAFTVSQNRLG